MRRLPKPKLSARATFENCVSWLRDEELAAHLFELSATVEAADISYQSHAANNSLFGLVDPVVGNENDAVQMVKLYTSVLSRKSSKVRHLYDEIRAGSKDDLCPLCAQRLVSTLDHYLEKARYPVYAVTPINLVPACTDCNKIRSRKVPNSQSDLTLHPYFDSVDRETWLKASVLETDPVVVKYHAAPPMTWNEILSARVQSHFRTLELGKLYSTHAATELTGMRSMLVGMVNREGTDHLRGHLLEQAASRRDTSLNSWQGAMFSALGASDWFCNRGYLLIPKPDVGDASP